MALLIDSRSASYLKESPARSLESANQLHPRTPSGQNCHTIEDLPVSASLLCEVTTLEAMIVSLVYNLFFSIG
jgi:hypothetical protein